MNVPGRPNRPSQRAVRSQFAVRLGLALYALLCAAIALRSVVLLLDFTDSVQSVSLILAATDPIIFPLTLAPAANRVIFGSATLADLTAMVILFAAVLPLLARRPLPR